MMRCPKCNERPMAVTNDIVWFGCGKTTHLREIGGVDGVFPCERPQMEVHRCFIPNESSPPLRTFNQWIKEASKEIKHG